MIHKYNGSESDGTTYARISKPDIKKFGSTNNWGHFCVLLDWFNWADICQTLSRKQMYIQYAYHDAKNLESPNMAVRLRAKNYQFDHNPDNLRMHFLDCHRAYMDGKEKDCGFSLLIFEIGYTVSTNTLEFKIDPYKFDKEEDDDL